MGRTDSASRVIRASAEKIYAAHLDPQAVAVWRPPQGMRAEIEMFYGREGGGYRMAFVYAAADHAVKGKTSEHADMFEGRFVELVPCARIVERVVFRSEDPAFAGAMTVTTTLTPVPRGTEVGIVCENVPAGIRAEDQQVGMASTLANLAVFPE